MPARPAADRWRWPGEPLTAADRCALGYCLQGDDRNTDGSTTYSYWPLRDPQGRRNRRQRTVDVARRAAGGRGPRRFRIPLQGNGPDADASFSFSCWSSSRETACRAWPDSRSPAGLPRDSTVSLVFIELYFITFSFCSVVLYNLI